ncbi:YkvA family protein [Lacisediminimonas profundi]|uniref:YkvA family protein n=1 Tax=Lacisediminimonas profundi TaxID=2603856 RepID=UPI00124B5F32|nr:YkvA family protein [Lacisediminimonas profundi]
MKLREKSVRKKSVSEKSVREKIRAWAGTIKRDGVTLWFACKHPHTPLAARALGVFVVAYALSPIDLIPDFIPVLGYLDDVILLPALIWLTIRMIPAGVLEASRVKAAEWMEREGQKPRSNWGILLVLVVWIAVTAGMWTWFAKAPGW